AEGTCGGRCEQGATPEARVIDANRAYAPERLHERETERKRQGGIEPDDDERLAYVLARAPLGIEGRVRNAQDLGCNGGVAADRLGNLRHLNVGISSELDDFRGDTGWTWEIDLCLEPSFEFLAVHLVCGQTLTAERVFH